MYVYRGAYYWNWWKIIIFSENKLSTTTRIILIIREKKNYKVTQEENFAII